MKPHFAVLFVLLLLILDIALAITIPLLLVIIGPSSPLFPYLTTADQLSGWVAVYLVLWLIVCVIYWIGKGEKLGFSGPPFGIVYRTARLNGWIDKISQARPTAWRTIWNLGIFTGVGSMLYISYQLIKNLLNLSFRTEQAFAVQPIIPLPGLTVSFETFPYLVLALSVVLVSHELSHGIASLVDRVPLKSTGAFFGHVLMGGFVEPDEEKLTAAKPSTKLRVFAAGSFTNVVLGIICVLLLVNFQASISPFYDVVGSGVQIGDISQNLPASSSGLQAGDIVMTINGTRISSLADLRGYMSNVTPGEAITIGTERGAFPVKTTSDPNNSTRAIIGISGLTDYIEYHPKFAFLSSNFPNVLLRAELWLSIVLVSVGMINMLPIPVLDGDKFLETALNAMGVKKTKQIRSFANAAALSLLLLNIILSGLRFGFFPFVR